MSSSLFITDKLTQPQRDVVELCLLALDASEPPDRFHADERRQIAEIAVWRHGNRSPLHQLASAARALLDRQHEYSHRMLPPKLTECTAS